jgi:hypothetical protein
LRAFFFWANVLAMLISIHGARRFIFRSG